MKMLIMIIFMIFTFNGCGNSSSPGITTGTTENKTVHLADATASNALKAYNDMSVTTYLPSLYRAIYPDILNGGDDGQMECAIAGKIGIKYISLDENQRIKLIEHDFNQCYMNLDGRDIVLNGKIYSYVPKVQDTDVLHGLIEDGFNFKVEGMIDMRYKIFPFKNFESEISDDIMSAFLKEHKGSIFTVAKIQKSETIENFSAYSEKTLGEITFYGTFIKYVEWAGDKNLNGIAATYSEGFMSNYFIPEDIQDYLYKLVIFINPYEYLDYDEDMDFEGDKIETLLRGKGDKIADVWQDDTETVYAKTADEVKSSTTIFTPSFSTDFQ